MRRFVFPLAVALCFLGLVSQHSRVSAKDPWISVRTKNFYLIGNAKEKDVRKVALKLEQFREVFTRLLPQIKFNTPVPTTVVVFKSKSAYAPFGPPNTGGYFQAGPDVNYIALSTESYGPPGYSEDAVFNIIFHEYTHLLVNNTLKNAPLWFNEGLAEYYSTFTISGDQKFELGNARANHVFFLRQATMLPLRTLFAVDHKSPHYNERSKKSIFYAQSWALLHYLIVGKEGMQQKLARFVNLLAVNVPVETAFPKAFEMSFEQMETELREYVSRNRYNYVKGTLKAKIELDTNTEAKPLTEAEAQAYLGDLLLHSNRPEAVRYLEEALTLDPNLGMAHASLGMLLFRKGKTDEARARLERAVAASSANYLAHYYYAFTLSRPGSGDVASKYIPEHIAKIREHLRRAIELRPDFPESYSLLAYVSLISGQEIDESIASMKRILNESPGRKDFTFMLAQLYMHKQDYKTARPMLEEVAKSNEDVSFSAQQMLERVNKYEKELAEYEEKKKKFAEMRRSSAGEAGAPDVIDGPVVGETYDPSSDLREALRKPAAGETQIMATLVRIDCEAKGIVFVLQTSAGLLRLRTNSFEGLDITTYTTDVTGEITCGPRKHANAVVVSYSPNTDKRVKADGVLKSVDFVPADFKLKPDR